MWLFKEWSYVTILHLFNTYSKLSRYETSTSSVPFQVILRIHIYKWEESDDNAKSFLSTLYKFIRRVQLLSTT